MATVSVLPMGIYAAGSYPIESTPLGDTVTSLQIGVQRCTTADPTVWPLATDTITFNLETSIDGAATWQNWNSPAGGPGGIAKDKFGVDVPVMYVQGSIPAGTARLMRGSVVLSGAIKTSATITVL